MDVRAGALQEAWLQDVAAEVSLPAVGPSVSQLLLPTVETELRRLIQLAKKYQLRGKQKVLTVADINLALSCNKLEPIYGLHRSSHLVDTLSSDPGAVIDLVYSNALSRAFLAGVAGLGSAGATDRPAAAKVHQGILIEDKVVSLVDLARQPLPKCPLITEVRLHWLAIDGVQPRTADNPHVECSDESVAPPMDLSREMQYLYSRIVKMILSNSGLATAVGSGVGLTRVASSSRTDLVCECLLTDVGLQDLVPYFCRFIYAQTKQNTRDIGLLVALMMMTAALLNNPSINLVPCLHQVLPAVFTCVVGAAGTSSANMTAHRCQLRDLAARIISTLCHKYGTSFADLYPRVCKTYLNAMLPEGSENLLPNVHTLYGGLVGTHALGYNAIKTLIMPRLDSLHGSIVKLGLVPNVNRKYSEADSSSFILVRSALVHALGSYLVHILKSSEMRRGGAALSLINIRKRKFVDSDQISAKKMKVAANNIDNRAENRMSASENDSAAAKIIASDGDSSMPLDDMSEQLIPFYCSASSMYDHCRMFI